MKKIFALGLSLMAGSLFAQDYNRDYEFRQNMEANRVPAAAEGMRHMFEFNVDSVESAALSFDKIKTKGQDADNGTNIDLDLNYAYGVHPNLQVGTRFEFFSGVKGSEDAENLSLSVGGIFNTNPDFTRSPFVSLYVGAGWAQQFGNDSSRDDLRFATLSIGKRFPLEHLGLKHVVFSPEVSAKFVNSTTDESLDYSQSIQFKLLQFSVFF